MILFFKYLLQDDEFDPNWPHSGPDDPGGPLLHIRSCLRGTLIYPDRRNIKTTKLLSCYVTG